MTASREELERRVERAVAIVERIERILDPDDEPAQLALAAGLAVEDARMARRILQGES